MRILIFCLSLFVTSLQAQNVLTCYNYSDFLQSDCVGCGLKDSTFSGILLVKDGNIYQPLVKPIKIKTRPNILDLEDGFATRVSLYINQITTYNTEASVLAFLRSCVAVESITIGDVTTIIHDSLATLTPDSIQRTGEVISLRDGTGSVIVDTSSINELQTLSIIDSTDRVFTLAISDGNSVKFKDNTSIDSTVVTEGYGILVTEPTPNTYNVALDTSKVATPYDITKTVKGNGVPTRVAWWAGTDSLSSSPNLYWDDINDELEVDSIPIGSNALYQLYAGEGAAAGATDATYSTFVGVSAGAGATNSHTATFIGKDAGKDAINAYSSNFLGIRAGQGATNANNSNFLGKSAGDAATNANRSNFFGDNAGYGATNANNSNFLGWNAGSGAADASYSNFLGVNSGYGATGATYSNFFGSLAGMGATGASYSNFFGGNAGSGAVNALGSNFLGNGAGGSALNASFSNFLGASAGTGATNASYSNFLGASAGNTAANASYSNFIGYRTGSINIGANNILIGTNISLPDGYANSMNIGSVMFGTGFYSNTVTKTTSANAGGKIGILTNDPARTLHVNGDMRLTGRVGTPIELLARDSIGDISSVTLDGLSIIDGTLTAASTSDSTQIIGGWGIESTEYPTNTWNLIVDSSQVATQYDISKKVKGSGVATRVAYWGGVDSLSSSANLYWDNVNNRLGVGISNPSWTIDALKDIRVNGCEIGLGNNNVSTNVRFGTFALQNNTSGGYNLAFGAFALRNNLVGSYNVALGSGALQFSNTNYNTAIGANSLYNNSGTGNTAISAFAGESNASGSYNTSLGMQAATANNSGNYGVAIGYQSLFSNISGGNNVAVGTQSLRQTIGSFNVGLGNQSGFFETGSNRLYIENSASSIPLIGGHFDNRRIGINTLITDIGRTLDVNGEVRIRDLTTDTPVKLVGASNSGDLNEVNISNGLTLSGSAITANINGTTNRIPKFTSQYGIGNSQIYTIGDTLVGINQSNPQYHLDVTGKFRVTNRTGTAATGAGFTANGQLVAYSLDTAAATPNTYVQSGTSVNITGTGTMADPYTINNTAPENTSVKDGTHIDFIELANDTITGTIKTGSIGATELASTSVSAGTYNFASITVDADGRITSANSNTDNAGVTSIATTSPITGGTITNTGTIGIQNASANSVTKGAATFNSVDFDDNAAGLISIDYTNGQAASTSTKGFLTSTDWNTFNNKQSALVSGTNIKTINGNTILGSGNLNVGTVTGVTATSPLFSSGGAAPNLTIQNASTSTTGALTSTDWNTFNGKMSGSGTANKLAYFSGTNTVSSQNTIHINPATGTMSFNLGVSGLYPITVVSDGSNRAASFTNDLSTRGLWIEPTTTSGSTARLVGNFKVDGTLINASDSPGSIGQVLTSQGPSAWTWSTLSNGTVTNFSSGALSPLFTTSVSNATTTPALNFAAVSQSPNLFYASPNGFSGTPTFRSLAVADVPTLNQSTTGSAASLGTGRTISITGDLSYTSGSFNGTSNVTGTGTLATVNSNVGTFTNSTITVDAKGRITAASTGSSSAPQTWIEWAGGSGASVVSYGSTGTINSGKLVGIGTLDPTRVLDVNGNARIRGAIYDSGNTAGSSGQVLTSNGTGAWSWTTPSGGATNLSYSTKVGTDVTLESSTGADVILRDGVGSTVNRVASNIVKIDVTEADGSTINEGYLGVTAGSSTSSVLQGYNASGFTTGSGVTINAGQGMAISETTSTNGGQVTLTPLSSQVGQLSSVTTSVNYVSGIRQKLNFSTALSTAGIVPDMTTDRITVPTTGTYMVTYSFASSLIDKIFVGVFKGSTSNYISEGHSTIIGRTVSKTFFTSLPAGEYLELHVANNVTETGSIDYPVFAVQRIN